MSTSVRLVFDRRQVLRGLAAPVLAGAATGFPIQAVAATAVHLFRHGGTEITVISDGTLSFGLSFAVPSTPRAEVEQLLAANNLPIDGFVAQTNVVLVNTGRDLVLIDTGSGPNFQDTAGRLEQNLSAAGIDPAAVTKVAFTHAHPDHLWGAVDDFDASPKFPNATHLVTAAEWDYWTHPDTVRQVPEAFQGMAAGSARILKALESSLERVHPGDAVAPGLTLVETPGHTPGHVSVHVESGTSRLLVGGDVLGHPVVSFARPGWRWGTDTDPDRAADTRRKTLDMLASDDTLLLGYHLPWPGIGRVERQGDSYRFLSL